MTPEQQSPTVLIALRNSIARKEKGTGHLSKRKRLIFLNLKSDSSHGKADGEALSPYPKPREEHYRSLLSRSADRGHPDLEAA